MPQKAVRSSAHMGNNYFFRILSRLQNEKVLNGWVNEIDYKGRTPIHVAVRQGHCDQVDILLDKGADILVPDNRHRTAYHKARSPGVLKMLIARRGDPYRSVFTKVSSKLD